MVFIFLVALFFLIIAVCQDFKRREIDDWLNLSIFFILIVFNFIFLGNLHFDVFAFFIIICFFVSVGLYHARVFAGGDAKLLFSISPIFYSGFFLGSIYNFLLFVFVLFFGGAIYGLGYSMFFFIRERKISKNIFKKYFNNKSNYSFFILAFIFFCSGFIFAPFFVFSILFILWPVLFSFAKATEQVLYKSVYASDLREGDWLVRDIRFHDKIIKSSWEGLSAVDIKLLKNYSNKILVKDGIPYAPAFLIGLILYYYLVLIL